MSRHLFLGLAALLLASCGDETTSSSPDAAHQDSAQLDAPRQLDAGAALQDSTLQDQGKEASQADSQPADAGADSAADLALDAALDTSDAALDVTQDAALDVAPDVLVDGAVLLDGLAPDVTSPLDGAVLADAEADQALLDASPLADSGPDALAADSSSDGTSAAPKQILFAHGLNSNAGAWGTFRSYAEARGWTVYAFDVPPLGSIVERATSLAQQINQLNLQQDSLVVVGHSMGGLDLHYIISEGHKSPGSIFAQAARTFSRFYTIATPHKGNQFGGMDPTILGPIAALTGISLQDLIASDAVHDLGLAQMQAFNDAYPYTTFSIDGRKIPLMALRFSCIAGDELGDGVVAVPQQSLNGAPHSREIFAGAHMPDACKLPGIEEEQKQTTEILQQILANAVIPADVHDVVFYEGNDCTQDEKGVFISRKYTVASCSNTLMLENEHCANDEIRSLRIYPGVQKNTYIHVFDQDAARPDSLSDDWAVVHTGTQDLTQSVCINTFEQQTTTAMENLGLSMYYHRGAVLVLDSALDGKISRVTLSTTLRDGLVFYEGSNCTQQVKGYYKTDIETHEDCTASQSCANDEIQSLLILPGVEQGSIIKVYDDHTGSLSDDWTFINRGEQDLTLPFCVNGFEHATSSREAAAGLATYWREYNGINGKISYIKVTKIKDSKLVFYEGDNCGQQVKGLFEAGSASDDYSLECQGYSGQGTCANDEIRSLLIQPGVLAGKDLRVFDSPSQSTSDDYTSVYRGFQVFDAPFCINGFEHDTSSREAAAGITVNYHPNNGLNGKISYIRILDNL